MPLNNHHIWNRLASPKADVRDDARREYQSWLQDPTTQQMLAMVRGMVDAYLDFPLPPTPLGAKQRMWMLHGMRAVERRLAGADAEADEVLRDMLAAAKSDELTRTDSHLWNTDPKE